MNLWSPIRGVRRDFSVFQIEHFSQLPQIHFKNQKCCLKKKNHQQFPLLKHRYVNLKCPLTTTGIRRQLPVHQRPANGLQDKQSVIVFWRRIFCAPTIIPKAEGEHKLVESSSTKPNHEPVTRSQRTPPVPQTSSSVDRRNYYNCDGGQDHVVELPADVPFGNALAREMVWFISNGWQHYNFPVKLPYILFV